MKIYTEKSLSNFEFWGGAVETVKYLTDKELDFIEDLLESEDTENTGIDETDLNDLFAFEEDLIAQWLGYNHFVEIMNRGKEKETK